MKDWLVKLALVCIAALSPIQGVLVSVGLLVFADLVTGVWAAVKRGETVKSAALRRSVSKFVVYQIAVISGFIVETWLLQGSIPVVKILGGLIGLVEFKSLLENCNTITGTDLFKEAIKRLGSQNDTK